MQINSSNINDYLKRFFDGDTTCAEETELCRYFREEKRLPEGLERYKDMFAWIDAGMPEPIAQKKRPAVLKRPAFWWSTAAAIIIVAITVMAYSLNYNEEQLLRSRNEIYNGSYVETTMGKNTDIAAIMPDIEFAIKEAEEMERELDNLNFDYPDIMM